MSASSESGDDIFAISEDLVQSPEHKAAGQSSLDFDGLLKTPLRLHEDLSEGCGGQLWPAGMVLTKYMLRRQADEMRNRSMLVSVFVRNSDSNEPANMSKVSNWAQVED